MLIQLLIMNIYHIYRIPIQLFFNNDEIILPIQTQERYFLPSQSFSYVDSEGKFSQNLLIFFFEIRYEMCGFIVD